MSSTDEIGTGEVDVDMRRPKNDDVVDDAKPALSQEA
jgi:hypothetical protein